MAGTWDAEALGGVSSASVQELEAKNARGEGGPRSAPKAGAPTSELQRVWAREEELRKSGEVVSHLGATCGRLEGFDFHSIQAAAAYLVLIDPAFVQDE